MRFLLAAVLRQASHPIFLSPAMLRQAIYLIFFLVAALREPLKQPLKHDLGAGCPISG
ncbi:hypothetical protein NC99_09230 [Sunxiuqinia dokdonensis]|uniref:Uncharacterized protein n=1 Tax=Sunxiuqinia dokdonensis TaxID=1409788 RepID=A0A0L8VD40_9BACT|nr:hypothetical protein NC99_09230 [Sunxiuqinia dokdonensis]